MSATETRMPIHEARRIAFDIIRELGDYCERIEIAGSIRRRKAFVKDIELVAIPSMDRMQRDLLGDVWEDVDLLHVAMERLLITGAVAQRLDINGRPRWGKKLKFAFWGPERVPLDLFCTTPQQWGLSLMIRTGPAEFNKRWVTQKHEGGTVLPFGMRVHDGWLWRGNRQLETPTEASVFEAIGLDYIAPEERE